MGGSIDRGRAIELLNDSATEFLAPLEQLREDDAKRPNAIGGGAWSAKDLVGHVETWEQVALQTIEDVKGGRRPGIHESVVDESALDEFNASEINRKASRSWMAALSAYRDTHERLIRVIDTLSDSDWDAKISGDETRSLGQEIGGNTGAPTGPFEHIYAHLDHLRALVEPGP